MKEWREKGPEIAAHREVLTQMHLHGTAEVMEKPSDQMETEEPDGEPSRVEITMDASKMDTTCDWHILPLAESPVEVAYIQHLLEKEDDEPIWTLIALRYMESLGREIHQSSEPGPRAGR